MGWSWTPTTVHEAAQVWIHRADNYSDARDAGKVAVGHARQGSRGGTVRSTTREGRLSERRSLFFEAASAQPPTRHASRRLVGPGTFGAGLAGLGLTARGNPRQPSCQRPRSLGGQGRFPRDKKLALG